VEVVKAGYSCAAADPVVETTVVDLTKTVASGWDAVYAKAKAAGARIGGCALALVVQAFMSNRSAPPTVSDGWSAATTMDRFRRDVAGGATFHVEHEDGTVADY